ncbi:inner nuclear membrane protein Man1 [Orussus abietinus]|uniref:inner nuclear membrane protein Man1 n=1 Tax=Orussus abietinus TaxID=222816 RepID=UPI000626D5D3|nr:inner nuclear membrane protein Man1 [Orussus abietinus]
MSVEALSDSELRTKLAEYGYPVGPVTQTTRKILVRKLKNLIETRGGTGSRHSLAARYSSDDTDDDGSTATRKKKTNLRRQTMANPMPPPMSSAVPSPAPSIVSRSVAKRRTATKDPESKSLSESEFGDHPLQVSNHSIVKTVHKKYTRAYNVSSTTDGLETGSDSDIMEEVDKNRSQTIHKTSPVNSYELGKRDHDLPISDQPSKPYDMKSTSSYSVKDDKYSSPSYKPIISSIQPMKEDIYVRDKSSNDPLANFETPYLSEFTRRLSLQSSVNLPSASKSTVRSPTLHRTSAGLPEVKETDSNGHFSTLRSLYPLSASRFMKSSRFRDIGRTYKSSVGSKDEVKNNQNLISVLLVVVLALFFGILAFVYLGLSGKSDMPSLTPGNVPRCLSDKPDNNKPRENCVYSTDEIPAMQLLKDLQPILMQKAAAAVCDDTRGSPPYLTDEDIEMLQPTNVKVREDLRNAQLLAFKNPEWRISFIEFDENDSGNEKVLDSMERIIEARTNHKLGMVILNPKLPLQCFIRIKVYTVLSYMLIISLGILTIVGTQRLVLWYLRYKKTTEREVFQLVSEIIGMVELHHQNSLMANPNNTKETYLAINHVRDNLIPPEKRKKMVHLWEKAVKFIDENESRLRREVQQVAGEEFHVWRWLSCNSLSPSNSPIANKKSKVWQGQAFETMEGSVNSLTYSPTPCLKIRHMFDPDIEFEDDWEVKVQDAILEKCGEAVGILHIRVDRGSREGCVYMKCMSQEDAGKAYRALHGCWFDGHLVTVKYLRLERYHERFPDAIHCSIPLKPSNNQQLSMQAHYTVYANKNNDNCPVP